MEGYRYMMSPEQINYLKQVKRKKALTLLTQVLLFLFIIIIWQILSDKKIIDSFITSSPLRIIETSVNIYKEGNFNTFHNTNGP